MHDRGRPVAVDDLLDRLGSEIVVVDVDILGSYRRDQAAFADAGEPAALVRAQKTSDVVEVLGIANRHGIPVITRGAGTGLSGGANAIEGCVVLSVAAMDRILDINVPRRLATVECGVLNGTLARAVGAHGLWYPPDPASREISTIGGNIATNAGGACCLKYGVTGDHVAGVTAVLADGSMITTGAPTRKNVAGLDLTSLLVGSEGTLAVIVEATVRLRPTPSPPSTLVAFFASPEAAGEAVVAILEVAQPSLLELMDRTTVRAVEEMTHMGLETDAGALLVVQSNSASAAIEIEAVASACAAFGATYQAHTTDVADGELFLEARRAALPALERLGTTLLDDVAVPVPSVPAMLEGIRRIGERRQVTIGTFGHAGDGNLHPTLVFDAAAPESVASARLAFDDIVRLSLDSGGTITGEHGVGCLKMPYMEEMVGPTARSLMLGIKRAFDPNGILNPGRGI
ncbi:MAG TPA: FAD-linked oxidase C-terminal domain-containing protein [Acidimicrobiales bacterium]|nr:FAD-linked oxidase C-terminal domain-containing protein [Acidimicrobiales bacterium]